MVRINTYEFYDDYVVGKTKGGVEFYVDKEDYNLIKDYNWRSRSQRIKAVIDGEDVCLHNFITGYKNVSHLNGDTKDNRRSNLVVKEFNRKKVILNGYIAIYKPEHPRAYSNGCVYEHILVAEQILGRFLTEEECVHHKDRNRKNNSPDNLMVFATNSDHIAYHAGWNVEKMPNGVYIAVNFESKNKEKVSDKINEKPESSNVIKIKSKNRAKTIKKCAACGREISLNANYCKECFDLKIRKAERPSKEELYKLILTTPFTRIAKIYGVTDNAIRKWCDAYGLPRRKRDIA